MQRGYLDFLNENNLYKGSIKDWRINLIQTNCFCYDFVVNEHALCGASQTKKRLKEIKDHVLNQMEKRFVYYIATRKRVRFSMSNRPILTGNRVSICVEIGKEKELRKLDIFVPEGSCIKVTSDPRVISFTGPSGNTTSHEIHSFLQSIDANLGIASEIQYVGMTKDPTRRPMFDGHIPLSRIAYEVDREEDDILVFFNVFKVMASAQNHRLNAEINIPNSATNEVSAEDEGRIIEKALIFYFMPKYNIGNSANEIGELKNKLITLSQENNFKRIDFSLEVDGSSEYFAYSSPSVPIRANHSFSCEISDIEVELNQIPSFV